jgi:hypothetical protein
VDPAKCDGRRFSIRLPQNVLAWNQSVLIVALECCIGVGMHCTSHTANGALLVNGSLTGVNARIYVINFTISANSITILSRL